MTTDDVSIPYVTFIASSGNLQIGDAGRARAPVGIDLDKLGALLRAQLEALHPQARGLTFRFSWYGSGVLLEALSGRVLRSMSSHLLVAVEAGTMQAADLEMLYAAASHRFGEAMKDVRRGAPERTVFVVHGHDEASLQKLAAFLVGMGCVPQILSRMPREGSETIIEALERVLPSAGLVAALFTEDDEGRARADSSAPLRPRARQNVLVEAGFAIIQRRADSIIVVLGDVEIPSDFGGILTVQAKEWGAKVEAQLSDFINVRL